MTWRPADWSPLASSDPAPGDPDEVDQIANRYRNTAIEIDRQARLLRSLSTAEGWDSDAGRVFAEDAGELSRRLGKTHGRYAAVSGQLCSWAPALREAQRETYCALRDAKEADARKRANHRSFVSGLVDLDQTDEEKAADRRRQRAYDDAVDDLSAARRRFDRAVEHLDDAADRVANAIREASDDDVKDGFWDKVKGFLHDHAKLIKTIAQIAGWVATLIAIFASGPFVLIALGIAVAVLATHALMAIVGEGSWLDVGIALLDVVPAFKLARVAGKAGTLLKGAHTAAKAHVGAKAFAGYVGRRQLQLRAAKHVITTRVPVGPLRRVAASYQTSVYARAGQAREAAEQAFALRPVVKPGVFAKLRHLDAGMAAHGEQAKRLAREFYDVPEVMANVQKVQAIARGVRDFQAAKIVVNALNDTHVFDPIKPAFTCNLRPMRW